MIRTVWYRVGMSAALLAGLLFVLDGGCEALPPLGRLLEPVDGLYRTARSAEHERSAKGRVAGLSSGVRVIRDDRGVPHIFADSDADAIRALGYVVAQDRLFQMDFIARVAGNRLAAVLGPGALDTDRHFRQIGLGWGARRNAERIRAEGGIEAAIGKWYCEGVNAWIDQLQEADYPFEFRLLGYAPEPCSMEHIVLVLQYMAYDLTFRTDDVAYTELMERLGRADFELLFPRHARYAVPIVPGRSGMETPTEVASDRRREASTPVPRTAGTLALADLRDRTEALSGGPGEGFREGMGSNNWAVAGSHSETGAPILAGDMHLRLSLPAIWYEAHLVTPSMNVYGVTIPGAPLPVEAFNAEVAWAFTNTGSDQVDFVGLELTDDGVGYITDGEAETFDLEVDTLFVAGRPPVLDTLRLSPWGPVHVRNGEGVAVSWVGHQPSRTLRALWGMIHAHDLSSFDASTRYWDAPMQNILYADVHGDIAIRSTGYLPARSIEQARGLVPSGVARDSWTRRLPFEDLPVSVNPERGYLHSANQDPTGPGYGHYLGHDWRSTYRSIRIEELLSARDRHSMADLGEYQSDVLSVRARRMTGLLATVDSLSAEAATLRERLLSWDGMMDLESREAAAFTVWVDALRELAWDEPEFSGLKSPADSELEYLLREHPTSRWLDVVDTDAVEDARGLLRSSLERTVSRGVPDRPWREGQHLVLEHVTRAKQLAGLWRGPIPFPGHAETVSPANTGGPNRETGSRVTHSASWRVVVDLSTSPPTAVGIYPGGQSGNPFSSKYDLHLESYLAFDHYRLINGTSPDEVLAASSGTELSLTP